jgi:hypothetical protein
MLRMYNSLRKYIPPLLSPPYTPSLIIPNAKGHCVTLSNTPRTSLEGPTTHCVPNGYILSYLPSLQARKGPLYAFSHTHGKFYKKCSVMGYTKY